MHRGMVPANAPLEAEAVQIMNSSAQVRAQAPPRADALTRPFGLDLGTSCVRGAAFVGGSATPIEDAGGSSSFPAVACFHGGTTRVGRAALGYGTSHPRDTVVDVMRSLARQGATPPRSAPVDRTGWSSLRRVSGEMPATTGARDLEETAALILRQPVDALRARLGVAPGPVVLAAPAWLGEGGRAALVGAARRAQMALPVLVTDVVARALTLAMTATSETRAAIVDLGAGGVSVAIVSIGWRRVDVLGVAGDGSLGGADLDAAIVRTLLASLPADLAATARSPDYALALRSLAEAMKRDLSLADVVETHVPFLRTRTGEPVRVTLDRATFAPFAAELDGHVSAVIAEALRSALLPASAVRHVHATGGMVRAPEVLCAVERHFAHKAHVRLGPDSVARGAALRAAMLDGDVDLVLTEGGAAPRSPRVPTIPPPPRLGSDLRVRVATLPLGLLETAAASAVASPPDSAPPTRPERKLTNGAFAAPASAPPRAPVAARQLSPTAPPSGSPPPRTQQPARPAQATTTSPFDSAPPTRPDRNLMNGAFFVPTSPASAPPRAPLAPRGQSATAPPSASPPGRAQPSARPAQGTTECLVGNESDEVWCLSDEEIETAFATITSRPVAHPPSRTPNGV